MISSTLGLYFALRPVGGAPGRTRDGFGWPTRSRALAFTAFVAEKRAGFRLAMAKLSMRQNALKRKLHLRFCAQYALR